MKILKRTFDYKLKVILSPFLVRFGYFRGMWSPEDYLYNNDSHRDLERQLLSYSHNLPYLSISMPVILHSWVMNSLHNDWSKFFKKKTIFNFIIKKMTSLISIQKIDTKIIKTNEFVFFKMFFEKTIQNTFTTAIVIMKIHVVDDFKIKFFIENDVLISQNMTFNLNIQKFVIKNCQNVEIFIKIKTKKKLHVKRIIWIKQIFVITFGATVKFSITFKKNLFSDRGFFFESQLSHCHDLNHDGNVFVHIINVNLNYVLIKNATRTSVIFFKKTNMKSIIEYTQQKCYLTNFDDANFAANEWISSKKQNHKNPV